MGVSTFHDQNFLTSFFTHFHFVPLQGFKMCSFEQHPSQLNVLVFETLSFCALVKGLRYLPLSNILLGMYKSNHANTKCAKKMELMLRALNNILNSQNVFHS
jgi:hypothetical protein